VLITIQHLSLSKPRWAQSISCHPFTLISILISFSHLRLGLLHALLSSGSPTKTLHTFLFSSLYVPWPNHLNVLNFTTLIFGDNPFHEAPHYEMYIYYTLSRECDTELMNILTTATKQIAFSKTVGARTASVTTS
jgi:hypothetical protein